MIMRAKPETVLHVRSIDGYHRVVVGQEVDQWVEILAEVLDEPVATVAFWLLLTLHGSALRTACNLYWLERRGAA